MKKKSESIRAAIIRRRDEKQLSNPDLAALASVNYVQLWRFLTGKQDTTTTNADALLRVLGLTVRTE